MATIKQIEANRNNALLSTGPQTTEGKAVSSRNALSSGIYAARESVLPHEDPRDLDQLTREYYDQYAPATPGERCLVDSLISDEWMLRRFRRIEGEMLTRSIQVPEQHDRSISAAYQLNDRTLERLQRRINATRKSFLKSLEALRELEANRPPAAPLPQPEPIQLVPGANQPVGFVPSISARGPKTANPPSSVTMKTCPSTSMESSPRL